MSSTGSAQVIELDDTSDDEVKYLSTSRVATHFKGEDLCDMADIRRRNATIGSDETSLPLSNYNDQYIDLMMKRDHKDSHMTDYEIESMVQSVLDLKLESQSNYSSNCQSDDDLEVELIEDEDMKDWIPNVFLPPKEDIEYDLDMDYNLDLSESMDTCLTYCPFGAPKAYDSCQKAFGFNKTFLERIKRIDCKDVRLELHLFPSVLKGYSISCISGQKTGKTNAYLIPLMNWFDSQSEDNVNEDETSIGAIVICPSTRLTYDIARQARQWRDPEVAKQTVRIVSMNSSNAEKQYSSLINGCDILVSTPEPLLRAIETQAIGISGTRCLIIDGADVCLKVHRKTIQDIYIAFAKSKKSNETSKQRKGSDIKRNAMAFQTMTFAQKWTKEVEWFAKEIQNIPLVVFGSYYELSIAFKVESNIEVVNEEQREDLIVRLVERALEHNRHRIAIVCRTSEEITYLRRRLTSKVKTIVVTHKTAHFDLELLRNRWHRGDILLINDLAIKQVSGFKSCQCLIHYKLPFDFVNTFGERFRLMRDRFKKYKNAFNAQNTENLVQYIVVTAEDRQLIPQLISYLKRHKTPIPADLNRLYDYECRPLCANYCSFAVCPFQSFDCPNRHAFSRYDRPLPGVPKSGQIKITVTYVLSANEFYFRINEFRGESQMNGKWETMDVTYDQIKPELNARLDTPFNTITNVCEESQEIYGIAIRGQVFRVRLTKILGKETLNFYEDYDPKDNNQKIELFCIDFGHKLRSNSRQLFELPTHLKTYPALAFRGYLFGIKPIDNEIEWDFRATQNLYDLVDNYRIRQMTAWVLKQINGVFWINRLNVQKKLKNAKLNLETNSTDFLIKHKFVEQNDNKLSNVNTDYNKIVNIWQNSRLNRLAYNSCLVDDSTYVVVSDWVSVEEFYIIHESRVKRLQQLEDKWMLSLQSLKLLSELTEQQMCFYEYLDSIYNESSLNRAKIVSINGDSVDLFLVDHGQTVSNVSKERLYSIEESHLKELPFQAIKVSLFGVKQMKTITYDLMCELTRNDDDQYLMAIAEKVNQENGSNVIRLFVATDQNETNFKALSKLLVDLDYCQYIDGEENNELELIIQSLDDDSAEECTDFEQRLEEELIDKFVKDWWLKSLGLNENEDIDYGTNESSANGVPKESRISKKLRQLKNIQRNRNDDNCEDSDEEENQSNVNGFDGIEFADYKPYDENQVIHYYDPEDDFDRESLHSDEDAIIETEEMS